MGSRQWYSDCYWKSLGGSFKGIFVMNMSRDLFHWIKFSPALLQKSSRERGSLITTTYASSSMASLPPELVLFLCPGRLLEANRPPMQSRKNHRNSPCHVKFEIVPITVILTLEFRTLKKRWIRQPKTTLPKTRPLGVRHPVHVLFLKKSGGSG